MKVSVYVKKSVYNEFKPLLDHLEMPFSQFLRLVIEQPYVLTMVNQLMEIAKVEKELKEKRK